MQSTEDIQVLEVDSDAVLMRLERAQDEIDRLTESRTNWRWSIPANPDRDSDLILSDSVRDVAPLLAALAAERDRADRAEAVIEEIRNAITTTDEGWMIADDDKLAEILEAAQ